MLLLGEELARVELQSAQAGRPHDAGALQEQGGPAGMLRRAKIQPHAEAEAQAARQGRRSGEAHHAPPERGAELEEAAAAARRPAQPD